MVLTITVVGNSGQANSNDGQTVMSPNELAQLMSGQAVTGLLNPDGSITLNSNVVPGSQHTMATSSLPQQNQGTLNNGTQQNMNLSYSMPVTSGQSIVSDIPRQTVIQQPMLNTNTSTTTATATKKTGQKRLTAKQKQALQAQQQNQQQQLLQQQQQNQQQHMQQPMMVMQQQPVDQMQSSSLGHQPQVVATVQLPNGQIGQLIAPPGVQYWSPSAINIQQLSMAVAAATGAMPQSLSLPVTSSQLATSSTSSPQTINSSILSSPGQSQQQQTTHAPQHQQQHQQNPQQQQSGPNIPHQSLQQNQHLLGGQNGSNSNTQNISSNISQIGHQANIRQGDANIGPNNNMQLQQQNQLWSGGPISLSQLSALAQQGVIQLSPVQATMAGGQLVPQPAIQGLLSQPHSSSGSDNIMNQDPEEQNNWQIVNQQSSQQNSAINNQHLQRAPTQQSSIKTECLTPNPDTHIQYITNNNNNINNADQGTTIGMSGLSHDNVSHTTTSNHDSNQAQSQRKLKRLACTCPNCRDGNNNRGTTAGEKKKQHICHFPDCNKVYGKTSHLRAHLRWHSGERPYVCSWPFCGKKFTRSDELQRHRRTHTGEKRFQCQECLKRFMRSDHLSKHLKTHLSSKRI